MQEFNQNEEESNVNELVLQYEGMLAMGNMIFMEPEAFQDIIDYYEEQFLYDKALAVIDLAISQHSYSAIFYIRKAQLLLEEDRLEQAAAALEIAKLYEPSNIDIFLTEAELFHQQQQYDAALEKLDAARLIAGNEDQEDIWMLEASIHESTEDFDTSFDCLAEVLVKNPFNETAYSRLWMCMELTECYEKGIDLHKKLIDIAPYSYWAWYNLGHAYSQLEQYEEAFEAYDYAIVINEHFEFAYRDLIHCLFRLERYEEAVNYLQDYKQLFEIDADLLLWEGECYECLKDFEKARSVYVEALKLDNLEGRVHYRFGVSYANEEDWKKALKFFEEAYAQNNENEEFCIALAEVHNQLDEVDLAHTYYNKALLIAPEESVTWISYLEFLIDEEAYVSGLEVVTEAREHIDDMLVDFAEVALLILSGARKEGLLKWMLVLEDHYEDFQKLFELAPELESDAELWAMARGAGN